MRPFVQQLKFGQNWIAEQDRDLKSSSKSTLKILKKFNIGLLQWLSQCLNLNMIKMLLQDVERAVHKEVPAELKELKQRC